MLAEMFLQTALGAMIQFHLRRVIGKVDTSTHMDGYRVRT
jgi:hypothetical protein